MRLLAVFENEKKAYVFSSFLSREGVQNAYEFYVNPENQHKQYRLWVYEEDSLPIAVEWLAAFQQNPEDLKFASSKASPPVALTVVREEKKESIEDHHWKIKTSVPLKPYQLSFSLTNILLFLCIALFLWNEIQENRIVRNQGNFALQIGFTPIQRTLIFDYPYSFQILEDMLVEYPLQPQEETIENLSPQARLLFQKAEETPYWKGIASFALEMPKQGWAYIKTIPLFEKIRKGQIWRLFTPSLLHRDFLHILFNMAWLWILGKQIEERLSKWKMILLILVLGVASNVAQYLISGPYFLGFSGVVCGMVGFIWMRQRKAPWEGYPLQHMTILFILIFVAAMFGLEVVSFILQLFSIVKISASIANTAHIVGGLCGMLLGRFSFFSREAS